MPKPRKVIHTALCTACGGVYSEKQWKSKKLCCGRDPIVYESMNESFAGQAILEYLRR